MRKKSDQKTQSEIIKAYKDGETMLSMPGVGELLNKVLQKNVKGNSIEADTVRKVFAGKMLQAIFSIALGKSSKKKKK